MCSFMGIFSFSIEIVEKAFVDLTIVGFCTKV